MLRRLVATLAFAWLIAFNPAASAQTDPSIVTEPWDARSFGETHDKPLYEPGGHVRGEDADTHLFWWDSAGRFRLDRNDDPALAIGYRWLTIDFNANSAQIPDHLDDISVALGVPVGTLAGGELSFVLGAGYASDSPFADLNGLYGVGHAVWSKPLNDRDALVLSVDYDGNSEFLPDVPLPGMQFVRRFEPASFGVGFPKSWIEWKLSKPLTLTASYAVPYTAAVRLEYAFSDHVSVFGGGQNSFDGVRLRDEDTTDRIFFQMSRAELGVRYRDTLFGWLYTDVALTAGYAFNQNIDRGFDARQLDHVTSLSDEPYVGLVVVGRY